ncbi:MAG TPA: hypothetical protein VE621_17605, partial [Bryobacteraceae bacterium]|nr:hypothetical protein [Bryobacteraceae bacterium]
GRVATKGAATIETRSGNLERTSTNWSPWAPLNGDRIASPPARFLQYRATLTAPAEVSEIELAYEARNVAPSIDLIEITPPNYKFPAPSAGLGISTTLSLPPLGQKKRPSPPSVETTTTPSMTLARYFIGARWTASDPNNDELEYTVLIRGEREREWKTLKEKIREKYISWDSSAFPDGGYFLSVIVSDAPDNTPDQALSTKKESDRFVIDNTPPKIANLTATRAGKSIHATWSGNDALSNIVRAEYSLNGGDWTLVQPVSRLFDAPNQQFDLNINDVNGTEITLAVRLTDEFDNQSVEKIVVR